MADGLVDGERVAGVLLRQEGETVIGEVYGEADVEVVKRQVSRILSLDVDGTGFPGVARGETPSWAGCSGATRV